MAMLVTTLLVLLISQITGAMKQIISQEGGTHSPETKESVDIIDLMGCNLEDLTKQNMFNIEELLLAELITQKAEVKSLKRMVENKDETVWNLSQIKEHLQSNIDETIKERDNILKLRDEEISALKIQNSDKASTIEKIQNDLQSCQSRLYTVEPQLRTIKRELIEAQQSLSNVTQNAIFWENKLDTELILKETYQKEIRQEKQSTQIATMNLQDTKLYSKFLRNFVDFQKKQLDQYQNITQSQDSIIAEMKQAEATLRTENIALQTQLSEKLSENQEISLLLNLTKSQNENCQNDALSNESALTERKQLSAIQSSSLEAFKNYLDVLVPDDNDRARVRRNSNGTIISGSLCQCIPEPTKESHLQVTSLKMACEPDMTIKSNNSISLQETYEIPCSDGKCAIDGDNWPQCKPVLQKPWSEWTYTKCSKISIDNFVEECGSGSKRRTRMVREAINGSWIQENETVDCPSCFLSSSWSSWGSCNGGRYGTRTRTRTGESSMNQLTSLAFRDIGIELKQSATTTETRSCYG